MKVSDLSSMICYSKFYHYITFNFITFIQFLSKATSNKCIQDATQRERESCKQATSNYIYFTFCLSWAKRLSEQSSFQAATEYLQGFSCPVVSRELFFLCGPTHRFLLQGTALCRKKPKKVSSESDVNAPLNRQRFSELSLQSCFG